MYPFPLSVNPAVRTHIDAQTAFANDMAKSMFQSFQQMCNLNIRLMQTLLEETALAGQQMFSADRAPAMLAAAASRAQQDSKQHQLKIWTGEPQAAMQGGQQGTGPDARGGD